MNKSPHLRRDIVEDLKSHLRRMTSEELLGVLEYVTGEKYDIENVGGQLKHVRTALNEEEE